MSTQDKPMEEKSDDPTPDSRLPTHVPQSPPPASRFATLAVHAGERAGWVGATPTVTPIYASSTFLSESARELDEVLGGERKSYVYSRYANPTVDALEAAINALEGGAATATFASGMAAMNAALLLVGMGPGDVVLAARDLYGATHSLLNTLFAPQGITPRYVDCNDSAAYAAALREAPRPRAVLVEPISNPLARVLDLDAVIRQAHEAGALAIVDNTFATPYLLRPLALGADIVVHSATKYLGGHGDASGGSVSVRDPALEERLRTLAKLLGSLLSPFEAHLVHRGVKTLALRVQRQCDNALAVARRLAEHPAVERVHYSGLHSHAGHAVATRLFRPGCYGGVLAFEVRGARRETIYRLMDSLRLLIPATTFGDVYSEVSYPVMSSHRSWSAERLAEAGIGEQVLRVSAGIEDPADIIADLEQALAAIG